MTSSKFLKLLCCRTMVAAMFMIFMIFKQYPLREYEMGINEPKTTKVKVFIFLSLYYLFFQLSIN